MAHEIGSFAKPEQIRFTDALPKTRSGKIMRRLLREIVTSNAVTGDVTTLEDLVGGDAPGRSARRGLVQRAAPGDAARDDQPRAARRPVARDGFGIAVLMGLPVAGSAGHACSSA